MALEARQQYSLGKEPLKSELVVPAIRSVLQAGERISKIYDKPLSFDTLFTHITDLTADITHFQGLALSPAQVKQTIELLAEKAHTATNDPFFEEMYLAGIKRTLQKTTIGTVEQVFSIVTNRFAKTFNPREVILSSAQRTSSGDERSLDTMIPLSMEEKGFGEVDESDTDPFERTKAWLQSAETNPQHREIVLAKLHHEPDVERRFDAAMVAAATKSLYYYVEYGKFADGNAQTEDTKEDSKSTKDTVTMSQLHTQLKDFLKTHGGLSHVFQYVGSHYFSSYDEALPVMTLLHTLGYYYPEESNIEFVLNEKLSTAGMTQGLVVPLHQAVQDLQLEQLGPYHTPFSQQLDRLYQLSQEECGERIRIPDNVEDRIELLCQKLQENPTLATRTIQPLQKELVTILTQKHDDQPLSYSRLYTLLQPTITRAISADVQIKEAILRALVKVLDRSLYTQSGRRMNEGSYHQQILLRPLSQEERALIESSERLLRAYEIITTPDQFGNYTLANSTMFSTEYHINGRVVIQIAAIMGFAPIESVFDYGKKLATQIIGIRLGWPTDIILSQNEPKAIRWYLQIHGQTSENLEKLAKISNCSVELLKKIRGYKNVTSTNKAEVLILTAQAIMQRDGRDWNHITFTELSEELHRIGIPIKPGAIKNYYDKGKLDELGSRIKTKVTNEQRFIVIDLKKAGISNEDIAQQVGIDQHTVWRILHPSDGSLLIDREGCPVILQTRRQESYSEHELLLMTALRTIGKSYGQIQQSLINNRKILGEQVLELTHQSIARAVHGVDVKYQLGRLQEFIKVIKELEPSIDIDELKDFWVKNEAVLNGSGLRRSRPNQHNGR